MAETPSFNYAPMFQMGEDKTEYYRLTDKFVSLGEFEGQPILKIEKEGITTLIHQALKM